MKLQEKRLIIDFFKRLPLKLILVAGIFFSAVYFFGSIAHEVFIEKEEEFDNKIVEFFAPYSAASFIEAMKVFTFFGSGKFLLPAYFIICFFLLLKKKTILCVEIAIIAVTSTILSHGSKRLFQRARPEVPMIESLKTYSFPSGHALSSFIFCTVVGYLIWKSKLPLAVKWITLCLLLCFSLTIGLSRIVLKMHYPTDVLAGFLLGIVWVLVSFYIFNRVTRRKRNPAHQNVR